MSWYRDLHGTIDDPDGTGPVDDDGYRPTIGGLRHRTRYAVPPPDGTVVRTACELTWKKNSAPKSPPVADCEACET
ncbi:hypothetical protein [Amycolatopsis sp. CA-230715]|uniref:hypothetical protein n=1 Tax=Amycolatopsis sp. CA-230715 TaxID=2745196 RepID=UPI001C011E48|nr:hypothetical protein [Amycolatopsis sp. CA-230715]QWF78852.1 hypothetical protein HUW46_02250 [Amycolatopsis sp. CA-230715]